MYNDKNSRVGQHTNQKLFAAVHFLCNLIILMKCAGKLEYMFGRHIVSLKRVQIA